MNVSDLINNNAQATASHPNPPHQAFTSESVDTSSLIRSRRRALLIKNLNEAVNNEDLARVRDLSSEYKTQFAENIAFGLVASPITVFNPPHKSFSLDKDKTLKYLIDNNILDVKNDKSADDKSRTVDGSNVGILYYAVFKKANSTLIKLLIDNNGDVNEITKGKTPLDIAKEKYPNSKSVINTLIKNEAQSGSYFGCDKETAQNLQALESEIWEPIPDSSPQLPQVIGIKRRIEGEAKGISDGGCGR